MFVELSFIDLSLVSVFAISCTDDVKTELKDGFIKHRGNRQVWFHKNISVQFRNFGYRTPLGNAGRVGSTSSVDNTGSAGSTGIPSFILL